MYLYIYDECVSTKKNIKILTDIEKKLTDLGLNGKTLRINDIKKAENDIKKELKKGYKTTIVVGSDAMINKTVNAIASSGLTGADYKPALGVIPFGSQKNHIAEALGIKTPYEACDIILARRYVRINLGKINNSYFLSEIKIKNGDERLEINNNYSINISRPSAMHIVNFSPDIFADPRDDQLDFYIYTKKRGPGTLFKKGQVDQSCFPLKELTIKNKKASFLADYSQSLKSPATIFVADQKLNLIVGKNRNF
jgi:hypothetical protein